MSLLGRFLGGARSKAYAEGVALIEAGRYAEAVDSLRVAALGKSDTPSGSLASFQFRQALLREGRRLFRGNDKARALPYFSEAVALWDQYPDLHCLVGATRGLTGDWEAALLASRRALDLNPNYTEARLLEATSLQQLGRERQAAESLNELVATGRRVDHWLSDGFGDRAFSADTLPEDLPQLLARSLSGQSEKEEVASAVALCRAGDWDEGLTRFGDLVKRRPRYPDYRTRHAAALFQTGRNDEALAEVEAALALNENYRMAVDLKGLILADSGQLLAAERYLTAADQALRDAKPGNPHEAMFGAYLRAVLALMTGRSGAVRGILAEWPDLVHNFARAELLLAGAEYLAGDLAACGRRLEILVAEWSAEPLYFFLLSCHHLVTGNHHDVVTLVGRWPASAKDQADRRPLYLEALVALAEGRIPALSAESAAGGDLVDAAAWRFLRARALLLEGKDQECWQCCAGLVADGLATEQIVTLQTKAAAGAIDSLPANWLPEPVLADSCLAASVQLALARGQDGLGEAVLKPVRKAHPEFLPAIWLDAGFWLAPIRGWIA